MIAINNILVATDFGEASDSALRYGRELAGRFGATLHVLHVAENAYVDSDGSGPRTKAVVITSSSAAYAIVDYARDHGIDLIVMGTHGRGALAHLVMGSVAERVVRLASCPVLTVRHPEHEFVKPDTLQVTAAARA